MKIFIFSCFVVLLADVAFGQTASITGLVKDQTGAVLPGTTVVVMNIDTGIQRTAMTNDEGYYTIPLLQPGNYRITVQMPGFKPIVRSGIKLDVGQVARIDFIMEVGELTQEINVVAGAPLLESSTATLSSVVENKKIVDLPLNNRNVFSLLRLVPGVTPTVPNSESDFFTSAHRYSVNGGLESTTDIQLDGISTMAQSDLPGIYATSTLPSVEGIQEFRVQTNAFSAEYGRTGGGIVNMVTKSGTNEFHGSLFEFLRNSALDANNFFANRAGVKKPALQQHQFGVSLGGPILKDETFFFALYEGKRINTGTFIQYTVPTLRERAGDFSQTLNSRGELRVIYDPFTTRPDPNRPGRFIRDPFPNNVIPSNRIDPVAAKVITFYPEPNQPGLPFTNQLNLGIMKKHLFPTDRFEFKVDHNFNPSRRIFVRYNYFDSEAGGLDHWGNGATPTPGLMMWTTHSGVIDYMQTFGARTVVNARTGFNRFSAFRPSWAAGFDACTQLGWPHDICIQNRKTGFETFPFFSIQDYSSIGPSQGAPFISDNTNYTAVLAVSHARGRHSLKIGFETRLFFLGFAQYGNTPFSGNFSRSMTQGPDPRVPSDTAGVGMASFLLGTGDSGAMAHTPKPANANRYHALYVQDDVHWTTQLTMNIGFRWEIETGVTERFDRLSSIDPFVRNPISDQVGFDVFGGYLFAGKKRSLGRRAIRPPEHKPNPRIGLAYQLNDKTVIRAGYGIFFGVPNYGATNAFTGDPFFSSTPWIATLDGITPHYLLRNPFPDGFNLPTGAELGLLSQVGFRLFGAWPETLRTAYNQQWNLTIQRSLGNNMLLEVAYAGNKGTHLGAFEFGGPMNQLRPDQIRPENDLLTLVPNPFFGIIKSGPLAQPRVQRGQLLRPFPHFSFVSPKSPGWGNSNYHSLQTRLERRFYQGTSVMVAYTWSKLITDLVDGRWNDVLVNQPVFRNWYCRSCERAVSTYDVPHRLVLNFTYELPFGSGKTIGSMWNGVIQALLGGWQVNGILTLASGQPLVIQNPQNTSFSFGGGQHPDATGVDPRLGKEQSIDRWFNTEAFKRPAEFTFGNLGRTVTAVRQDATTNMDFSLFKNVSITEDMKLQIRVEAFNLTNTPIFGPPNTVLGSGSFGVVSSQANIPRQIQIGLKLLF